MQQRPLLRRSHALLLLFMLPIGLPLGCLAVLGDDYEIVGDDDDGGFGNDGPGSCPDDFCDECLYCACESQIIACENSDICVACVASGFVNCDFSEGATSSLYNCTVTNCPFSCFGSGEF